MKTRCIRKLVCSISVAVFFPAMVQGGDGTPYSFVVVADTAYKVPQDYVAYDKLIDRINTEAPAFTVHLGDVFSGQTNCGSANIERVKSDFGKYTHPVIYTPGDNEWTDCHGVEAGGYNPVERLANLRHLFFAGGRTLGQGQMAVVRQEHAGMVENALWSKGDVLFASVHIVGSNNGLIAENSGRDSSEFSHRNQANVDWIKRAFKQATDQDAKAMVLAYHANMFAEPDDVDGFSEVRTLIGQLGEAFKKPVLLVHGDHHQFIIDRPYLPRVQSGPGGNITRLQTYGWPDAKAVKISVDTSTENVFSFQPLFVGTGFY